MFFREIESCNDLLQSLLKIGDCLVNNHNKSEDSCLFSEIGIYENSIKKTLDSINKESFYGRNFGFHVSFLFSYNYYLEFLKLPISTGLIFTDTSNLAISCVYSVIFGRFLLQPTHTYKASAFSIHVS